MKASTPHARSCRPWLRNPRVWWLACAALLCTAACSGSGSHAADQLADPVETSDTPEVSAELPLEAALRDGAFATPESVGGFSTDGVGVFLTAVDNTAELTLYVVAPAKQATFYGPAMYLTTQVGDHAQTDIVEFEDVTLEAGESHVFRQEAGGTLMEVYADFAGENE